MPIRAIGGNSYQFDNSKGHEVQIGDSKDVLFYPQVKIRFWSNELNLSLRLRGFGTGTHTFKENKVRWDSDDGSAAMVFIDQGNDFDFRTVLKVKPDSNVIKYSIRSKNLKFEKQYALTQSEIEEDDNIGGNPKGQNSDRPENIINSFAVFHDSKKDNKYGSGKAFHIYRIKARDSNGNSTWCNQRIDTPTNRYQIQIPQNFLDSATYPVIIK